MTLPATLPQHRLNPGDDYAGAVVDTVSPLTLRCTGLTGDGCDARFPYDARRAARAARRGTRLTCPGCELDAAKALLSGRFDANRAPARGTATADLLKTAASYFGGKEFTYSQLVVSAWQENRQRWGLPNFEQLFPDANKVKVELCSTRPGGFSRFLVKVRPNTYKLTPEALKAARAIA